MVKLGMSIRDIDETEFESLMEYILLDAPDVCSGFIDEVI